MTDMESGKKINIRVTTELRPPQGMPVTSVPPVGGPPKARARFAIVAIIALLVSAFGGWVALDRGELVSGIFTEEVYADGPFAYRFTPGEVLIYALEARAGGSGFEQGAPGSIGLFMAYKMYVTTEEVDRKGVATLRLDFDDVIMRGNFMGEEVDLMMRGDDATFTRSGQRQVNTFQGDSIEGIPQLEFFKEPIRMRVAPNGVVLEVSGPKGFEKILSPAQSLVPVNFDKPALEINDSWTNEFKMPIPGLGIPATAIATSTLLGYETVDGRNCGVILQHLDSTQMDGTLDSPSSAMGEAMGFTMPRFLLSGDNKIYFDTDTGHLVRSDISVHFAIEIGEELKTLTDSIGTYTKLLDEIDNLGVRGSPRTTAPEEDSSLLDFGVDIIATLQLIG